MVVLPLTLSISLKSVARKDRLAVNVPLVALVGLNVSSSEYAPPISFAVNGDVPANGAPLMPLGLTVKSGYTGTADATPATITAMEAATVCSRILAFMFLAPEWI